MAVHSWLYGDSEVVYEGCVLDTYEHNGAWDSDFFAVCWDRDKKEIVNYEYGTTRCGSFGNAEIDATDDVLREVYRYYWDRGRDLFDSTENQAQAKTFGKGDTVEVVRGRKVATGTLGKVFWLGSVYNPYSRRTEDRVGIDAGGEKVFLPAEYVENADWQNRLLTGKERKKKIRNYAIRSMPVHYRDLFNPAEWERRKVCNLPLRYVN